MKTLFHTVFQIYRTGTEHYTCMNHDRLSMYGTPVPVHKYNVKVDNQNNNTKFDSIDSLFHVRFANTILSQLPRTCFAVLVFFNEGFPYCIKLSYSTF